MLILGLALGLLFQGVRTINLMQSRTVGAITEVRHLEQAERTLSGLLEESIELDASLKGDATGFYFDCPVERCSAALEDDGKSVFLKAVRGNVAQSYVLSIKQPVKLVYEGADGRYDSWPPSDRQVALRGVSVVGAAGGESPLIVARPWIEQPRDCEFDPISRTCRPRVDSSMVSVP